MRLIVKEEHRQILKLLDKPRSISYLSKNIGRGWPPTQSYITMMKEAKIVSTELKGRQRLVRLTTKGNILRKMIEDQDKLLEI